MSWASVLLGAKNLKSATRALQTTLVRLGYEIDGNERASQTIGPSTTAALAAFQKKCGLQATGLINPLTAYHLARQVPSLGLAVEDRSSPRADSSIVAEAAREPNLATNSGVDITSRPVPEELNSPARSATVSGVVHSSLGDHVAGKVIVAFARLLRTESELGRTVSDDEGRFRVDYAVPKLGTALDVGMSLTLRVYGDDDEEEVILRLDAPVPREAVIAVSLPAPGPRVASDFDVIAEALRVLGEGLQARDMTRSDVAFIANSLKSENVGRPAVQAFADAHRAADNLKIPPFVLYGFTRQAISIDPLATLSATSGVQLKALSTALYAGYVDAIDLAEMTGKQPGNDLDDVSAAAVEQIRKAAAESILGQKEVLGVPLGSLLGALLPDRDAQIRFAQLYVEHARSGVALWVKLEAEPSLREALPALRDGLKFSALALGHVPLALTLMHEKAKGRLQGPRDLAALGARDWKAFINKDGVGLPPAFAAVGVHADDMFADALMRAAADAYPTVAIGRRVIEDNDPDLADIGRFLTANPGFEASTMELGRYLQSNRQALNSTLNRPLLVEHLRAISRLSRLSPRYEHVAPLFKAGVHSANAVVRIGRGRFVESYSEALGNTETAGEIYDRAARSVTAAMHVTGEFNSALAGFAPAVVPKLSITPGVLPDWESLFGTFDLCACEDCRSVLSPAAYFADLMHFLTYLPAAQSGKSGKDVLLARRPDLAELELTCTNTNATVPYIDLVNEVLEDLVARRRFTVAPGLAQPLDDQKLQPDLADAFAKAGYPLGRELEIDVKEPGGWWVISDSAAGWRHVMAKELGIVAIRPFPQTGSSADDAATATADAFPTAAAVAGSGPEHTNKPAYDQLARAVYPWSLPFSLWDEEARALLGQLRVSRGELIRAFAPIDLPSAEVDRLASAEALGVSPVGGLEMALIAGTAQNSPQEIWGLAPVDDPVVSLTPLAALIQRTGLELDELQEAIVTSFVAPDANLKIVPAPSAPALTCDPRQQQVEGITPGSLDRLHRFVRLKRRTGWSSYELSEALARLAASISGPNGQFRDSLVVPFATIRSLQSALKLSVAELLTLWFNIPTRGKISLFRRVFLDESVLKPVDPAFRLNDAEDDLLSSGTKDKLSAHVLALTGALRIGAGDLSLLIASEAPKDELTLENLSKLYRVVMLATALGWRASDVLGLRAICAVDPFDASQPQAALRFVQIARALPTLGLGVADLGFVLNGSVPLVAGATSAGQVAAAGYMPTTDDLVRALDAMAVAISKPATSNPPAAAVAIDPQAVSAALLALPGWDAARAARGTAIIDGTSAESTAAQSAFITSDLSPFLGRPDAAQALVGLPDSPPLAPQGPRRAFVFSALAGLQPNLSAVSQALARALSVDPKIVNPLLLDLVPAGGNLGALPCIVDFLRLGLLRGETALQAADCGPQIAAAQLIARFGLLVSRIRLRPDGMTWMRDVVGLRDIIVSQVAAAVPLADDVQAKLFEALERLADLVRIRGEFTDGARVLTAVFASAAQAVGESAQFTEQIVALLAAATDWPADDIAALIGPLGLRLTTNPAAFADGSALVRISACLHLLRRLGVSAGLVMPAWTKSALSSDDSRAIRQAARSRYDDAGWASAIRPTANRLREMRRNALVAYLVPRPELARNKPLGQTAWRNANDLYMYCLVDVEMGACQDTSRIVQGLGAIHLFVQRCRLGLETGVLRTEVKGGGFWDVWAWMKEYRLWQANRQVFMYPENWLEPELRLDKSSFFADLEGDLRKRPVTDESASDALLTYLEKLDGVANLEVSALHFDSDGILHVFARTKAEPSKYYYRRLTQLWGWSAWEAVDLDIEGNHLIPATYDGRLFLYWAIFKREIDRQPVTMPKPGDTMPDSPAFWTIKMASSEYRAGKWSAKTIASPFLRWNIRPTNFYQDYSWKTGNPQTDTGTPPYDSTGEIVDLSVSPPNVSLAEWPSTHDFTFRINRNTVDTLAIDVYVKDFARLKYYPSGSEFPDYSFDHYELLIGHFRLSGCHAEIRVEYPDIDPNAQAPLANTQFEIEPPDFFESPSNTMPCDMGFTCWSEPAANTLSLDTDGAQSVPLLLAAEGRTQGETGIRGFSVLAPDESTVFGYKTPFAFSDPDRVFLVAPVVEPPSAVRTNSRSPDRATPAWRFTPFYHPFACDLLGRMRRSGHPADLLSRTAQLQNLSDNANGDYFQTVYSPTQWVEQPHPQLDVDFSYDGAYSLYNWELFFHIPLMIASRLSTNQQFEEAQSWFHYIFDPTDASSDTAPQRYWRTAPFYKQSTDEYRAEQIEALLDAMPGPDVVATPETEYVKNLRTQLYLSLFFPFEPHVIARLRTVAYQKSVVMKYLDNIIAWADNLFRQYNAETVNQAALLYILASQILGDRPEEIAPRARAPAQTYSDLEPKLDLFSNALVGIEELLPLSVLDPPYASSEAAVSPMLPGGPPSARPRPRPMPIVPRPPLPIMQLTTPYFCVPKNDKLLGYWDTVAGRLYKIRHCMDINGVVRPLPPFGPPIDPGALVRAVAAGLDVSAAAGAAQPGDLLPYRFSVVMQKASQLCAEVRAIGAALLAAFEKEDAEQLAALRSSNEVSLLGLMATVKEAQKKEADSLMLASGKAIQNATARKKFYTSRPSRNPDEQDHADRLDHAGEMHNAASAEQLLAGVFAAIPDTKIAAPTSAGFQYGGVNLYHASNAAATAITNLANRQLGLATQAQVAGGYGRRDDEWTHQADLASADIDHLTELNNAATIRSGLAQKEIDNHQAQIDQAQQVYDFLRAKYSNAELYDWMSGQLSSVYFQSYQLAFDMARTAERAYRYELGIDDADPTIINYGYWEDLHSGLLAGERLSLDLQRLDAAYLALNRRKFEITKHVSLLQLDPSALMTLLATGESTFDLPEWLFDMDYKGHYKRRIHSLSITIPCVTGPYTGVSCTLQLTGSRERIRDDATTPAAYTASYTDPKSKSFRTTAGSGEAIVTSSGQNDSGLFDIAGVQDRYVPFENAGVISAWNIFLPQAQNGFDVTSVSDVILHIRYTAVGSEALAAVAADPPDSAVVCLLSARHEYPNEWYKFSAPADPTAKGDPNRSIVLQCVVGPNNFLYRFRGRMSKAGTVKLFAQAKADPSGNVQDLSGNLTVTPPSTGALAGVQPQTAQLSSLGGLFFATGPMEFPSFQSGTWTVSLDQPDIAAALDDLIIMFAGPSPAAQGQGPVNGP